LVSFSAHYNLNVLMIWEEDALFLFRNEKGIY